MITLAKNKFFNYYLPTILSLVLLATAGFFWVAQTVKASTITLDSKANLGSFSAVTNTISFTNTGGNILFVETQAVNSTVSGATYNGVTMQKITTLSFTRTTNIFALGGGFGTGDPATGAHNVVITSLGGTNITAQAVSYSGVASSGQFDVAAVTTTGNIGGNSPGAANTITTVTNNDMLVIFWNTSDGGVACSLTNGTFEQADNWPVCFGDHLLPTAGSYTMNAISQGAGLNRAYQGYFIALKPVTTVAKLGNYLQVGGKFRQAGGKVIIK